MRVADTTTACVERQKIVVPPASTPPHSSCGSRATLRKVAGARSGGSGFQKIQNIETLIFVEFGLSGEGGNEIAVPCISIGLRKASV